MADGVTILHQASGELVAEKSLFKKPRGQAGTFLIIGSAKGIMPMFLARDAEDSMQAELLAFRIGRGDCVQAGNRIVLTDGQTMVFRGGPEAATIFVGTFILHSP